VRRFIVTIKIIAQTKKTARPDGQPRIYPWLVDAPVETEK
jgi:hypothetical protein